MFKCTAVVLALSGGAAGVPATMRLVKTTSILGCQAPFTSCVEVSTVATPKPSEGQALIGVKASSVNPSDVDTVEAPGGCFKGCGADVSGVVVACPGCKRLKVGDEVWTLAGPAYADYVLGPETGIALKPASLSFAEASTIPEVGLTSLLCLKRTGSPPGSPFPVASPWQDRKNVSVLITAGSGGTGFMGIELAKAYGADHILTSATGADGIAFVKSLGATFVVDYKVQDIFDALPADSVDIVYDNYGAEGTADKAMKVLRPGGVYLMLPHGECFVMKTQGPPCLSANPKKGVTQYNYDTASDAAHGLEGLDELSSLFKQGLLSAHIDKSFKLTDAALAFNYSAGPGDGGVGNHIGKISIQM